MTLLSGDRDTVHLFTVDLPEDDLWGFVTPDPISGEYPLAKALGVDSLDPTQVEGAVAEDLVGIGLAGFMIEGIGVDQAAVEADRDSIDALTGSVVLIRGAAFDGAQVPLTPTAPLAHFGTWEMTPAATTMEPLTSAAATGSVPPAPQPAPPPSPRQNRLAFWLIVGIGALIVLGLLFGLIA